MPRPVLRLLSCLCFAVGVGAQVSTAEIAWTGDVEPTDPTTWSVGTIGYVGNTADGSLDVTDGASLNCWHAYIADDTGVTGRASVVGDGSTWTLQRYLYVGYDGNGTLAIEDGGAVSSSHGFIGFDSSSTSQATVTGPGSTWTSSDTIRVGQYGQASLLIADGGTVDSVGGYVGLFSSSTGVATVTGPGSTWNVRTIPGPGDPWPGVPSTTADHFHIGKYGKGTLNVDDDVIVNVEGTTYLSYDAGGRGLLNFTGDRGRLTTGGLAATSSQLMGTGTINTHSFLSDFDMVFDSEASLTRTFTFNSLAGQDVTVNMDMASDPSKNGVFGAGWRSDSSTTVCNGITVHSDWGRIGEQEGATGHMTVTGNGTKWINRDRLYVGSFGTGTLVIADGAVVENGQVFVGNVVLGTGFVTVKGMGSQWINRERLFVGRTSDGTMAIRNGGFVSSVGGYVGAHSYATGRVLVAGPGSVWRNAGSIVMGDDEVASHIGVASVAIAAGGVVETEGMSIVDGSLLTIDVSNGSQLVIDGGVGTLENDGAIRVAAGAGIAAGAVCSPIVAGTWTGSGECRAIGGTWNATAHEFTASAVASGVSGTGVSIDLASVQRVLLEDTATGWSVGASLLSCDVATPIGFVATAIDGGLLTGEEGEFEAGAHVLGAWEFAITGEYGAESPVYLSFDVGPGLAWENLRVWRHDGVSWGEYDAWDSSYDGTYVSFAMDGRGAYAVTVPEPSAIVLILGMCCCVIGKKPRDCRWRW